MKKDAQKAVEWYAKAAQQGYAEAQFILGKFYEHGLDGSRDLEEALEWYKKAAEQGHEGAAKKVEELEGE